jgi:hypothetical protein
MHVPGKIQLYKQFAGDAQHATNINYLEFLNLKKQPAQPDPAHG